MKSKAFFLSVFLIVSIILTFFIPLFDIDFVPNVKANPSYEDFTTYTEVDSGDDITVTSSKITAIEIDTAAVSWVSKDKGAGYFDGDFSHRFELNVTADTSGSCAPYGLYEGSAGSIQDMKDGTRDGITVLLQGSTNRITLLVMKDGAWEGSDFWSPYVFNTKYYITVNRVASTKNVTVEIRTGSHEGTLEDTIFQIPTIVASCQTIYGLQSLEGGLGTQVSFEVEHLDLQEPEPQINVVELKSPNDATTETSWSVDFIFNATFYQTIQNASLHIQNTTTVPTAISWTTHHWNTSSVENKTDETIAYSFSGNGEGSYKWNVEVFNSTHGVYATSNRTLTIDSPPRYQNANSNSTSIQENGTILLYGQGYDGIGLDWAWLATNETETWKNYTTTSGHLNPGYHVPWGDTEKYETNPIFEANTSLAWEAGDHFVDVDVGREGSVYWLVYSSSYTSPSIDYRCVCIANSTDGLSWVKSDANPIFTYSGSGWDAMRVTYMSILKDTEGNIIKVDGNYWILYTGCDTGGGIWDIGLANSTSLEQTWTKSAGNPVLTHGSSGAWDDYRIHNPVFWKEGSTYYCLYSGSNSSNLYQIGLANSTDMINWNKYEGNPVMSPTGSGWEQDRVVAESINKIDGVYYLSYHGANVAAAKYKAGFANSTDLHSWTRYSNNPVIDNGGGGTWDEKLIDHSTVIDIGNEWWYYYTGVNSGDTAAKIGFAYVTGNNSYYNSPMDMNNVADQWTWSNFTWCNTSIPSGTVIQWRIYYNDTYGNINGTSIHSFTIGQQYLADLSQSLSTAWAVLTEWDAIADITQFIATSWIVLTKWNAILDVTQALSTSWNILANLNSFVDLSQAFSTTWNVLIGWDAILDFTQSLSTSWDILIQSTFNVIPTQALTTSWDVIVKSTFNVITSLSNTFSWAVDIVHTLAGGIAYIADLSQAISTSWTILTQWNAIADLTQSLSTTWNVLMQSSFNIVTSLSNTFTWTVDVVQGVITDYIVDLTLAVVTSWIIDVVRTPWTTIYATKGFVLATIMLLILIGTPLLAIIIWKIKR